MLRERRFLRRYPLIGLAILLTLCAVFIWQQWLTLSSFWGDPARWLFEAFRLANGEVLYRDFAWQYPPLSLFLVGGAFRVFGSTFATAQLVVDGLSIAVVLLTWVVARRLLPELLSLAVAVCLTSVGGTNPGNFALFSLKMYTPAQLTGMVGILMMLLGIIDYLQCGRMTTFRWLFVTIGSTISLLSKPEFMLGTVGCLIALGTVDVFPRLSEKRFRYFLCNYLLLGLASMGPAAIVYALLGKITGFDNLVAGVTGYGIASLACPWWPTGISLFSVLVALGQGGAFVALLSLVSDVRRGRCGWHSLVLCGAVIFGVITSAVYLRLYLGDYSSRPNLAPLLSYFVSIGTILLPVMWFGTLFWMYLSRQVGDALIRRNRMLLDSGVLFIVLTTAVLTSFRGFFGDMFDPYPKVAVAAYPLWFILGPYLLLSALNRLDSGEQSKKKNTSTWSWFSLVIVFTLLIAYSLARFWGGIVLDGGNKYTPLYTKAGIVHLLDKTSANVYRYVLDRTDNQDYVLDVGYGGGVNFAAQRFSPIYSTQFANLAPSDKYLEMDLERIQQSPPKVVIWREEFSYGVYKETACTFPRLVWRSDKLAGDPKKVFPVLEYIKKHYHPKEVFDSITIYTKND